MEDPQLNEAEVEVGKEDEMFEGCMLIEPSNKELTNPKNFHIIPIDQVLEEKFVYLNVSKASEHWNQLMEQQQLDTEEIYQLKDGHIFNNKLYKGKTKDRQIFKKIVYEIELTKQPLSYPLAYQYLFNIKDENNQVLDSFKKYLTKTSPTLNKTNVQDVKQFFELRRQENPRLTQKQISQIWSLNLREPEEIRDLVKGMKSPLDFSDEFLTNIGNYLSHKNKD